METQLTEKASSSSSSALPGGSPSPPLALVTTLPGALVVLGVVAAVCLVAPGASTAYIHGTAEEASRAWKVLAACAGTLLGVAAPTSFRDVLAVAKRFLPGGKS